MSVPRPAPAPEDANPDCNARGARRRWQVAVVLLGLLGAGLVLLATARYGAGLTTDSVAYLDVARNFVSGRGYVFHTGEPLIWWPPLYPMLLAFIGLVTGLDPAAFVQAVNAVLFALLICLSACLYRSGSQHSATYGALVVCAMLFSVPLSGIYAMAWSECLFIPLVVLFLVCAQRYRHNGGLPSLAVMTLSAALACLTRYIGATLVLVGALVIMFATDGSRRTRFTRAFAFAVLSLVPLGFWLARNHQQAGTLSGNRFHPGFEIVTNTILLPISVLSWYEPVGLAMKSVSDAAEQTVKSTSMLANLFVALVGIVALAAALMLSRPARRRLSSSIREVVSDHLPALVFLAVYSVALLLLAARGASSFIDHRLLSPVYVPATLVLLKLAYSLFSPTRRVPNASAGTTPALLLALWLCFPLASVARSTFRRFKNGAGGYSTRTWRESETVAYARQVSSAGDDLHLYSNGQDALWALARVNANWIPGRAEFNLTGLEGRWPPEDASVIVWFKSIHWRKDLFSIEELAEISNVEEVAHLTDGSIYRVSARKADVQDSTPRVSGGRTTTSDSLPDERGPADPLRR